MKDAENLNTHHVKDGELITDFHVNALYTNVIFLQA